MRASAEPTVHLPCRLRHACALLPGTNSLIVCGGHIKLHEHLERLNSVGVGAICPSPPPSSDETHIIDLSNYSVRKVEGKGYNFILEKKTHPCMRLPRISRHSLVPHGTKVYSLCGILQDKTKINDVYCYDPVKDTWERVETKGTPPAPRNDSVAVAWRNYILLFGGSIEGLIFPMVFSQEFRLTSLISS